MNIPCFLKSIDDTEYNIWFVSIEEMEAFIIRENAKTNNTDLGTGLGEGSETGEADSPAG